MVTSKNPTLSISQAKKWLQEFTPIIFMYCKKEEGLAASYADILLSNNYSCTICANAVRLFIYMELGFLLTFELKYLPMLV